ncbi:BREX-2 system adenine-specific DNA-methyltransferase PglX [Nocardia sp. BMG111209]|uniref:BREX-2 system adenine-specific DNA-methyltransferase PglX n=1 Tax=Nocardia sp. BMG111209 TaxID=1160137 RepID=UPI001E60E4C0|nr:BREX-2 system adenine-specific DNA-methyltransferase PglX [Nocardia sp. BMG111209]
MLGTVFVRFCEDNQLIAEPYLTGPTDDRRELAQVRYDSYVESDPDPTYRGWLEQAFAELGAGQAGKLLFDPAHNALYQIPVSHDGARELIEFWRGRNENGVLVHDFTDPLGDDDVTGWDTRFLGDLYQDLSENIRKNYALLQTPEFVEEFILDRTLKPAIGEFGYEQIELIDPACGSGHFVLGAFRRLARCWADEQPTRDRHERVRAALNSVHGVDMNPFAIAIARFRMLMAAMAAADVRTLAEAARYEWPIKLAIGDSLIRARQLELAFDGGKGDPLAEFSYATEDVHEYPRILEPERYHVVVGNPPYIRVKDKNLDELYRKLYKACSGKYALSVPFAQRFFELAKLGDPDGRGFGRVGQITANSFMKREFGTRLIEEFFAHTVELTEVIDTSGAFIPGHGTPTVILIGTRRSGKSRSSTIRTVRGVQGEPRAPKEPEKGLVWRAIVDRIDDAPGPGKWVSVDNLERHRYFAKQPWIMLDNGLEMVQQISARGTGRLRSVLARDIGFASFPGQDDAFISTPDALHRQCITAPISRWLIIGEVVRDWHLHCSEQAVVPYDAEFKPLPYDEESSWGRRLWKVRSRLRSTTDVGGKTQEDLGKPWWAWYRWVPDRYATPLSITFAEVATHNHFVLDRGGKVFKQTAPVIKLPEGAGEEDHLGLLGLLNSSTACFWLKMSCQDKPSNGIGRGLESEKWTVRYQFNSSNVEEFPIIGNFPLPYVGLLDGLADKLESASARKVAERSPFDLSGSCAQWESIRRRMIALQEELDWYIYSLYDLCGNLTVPELDVPDINLGERAFEIVMARKVESGQLDTEWFRRHGSTPVTEIPGHWPEYYREIVRRRIDAIESSRAVNMIERPEYKRRWLTDGWKVLQERALRSWLLDRMESRDLWFNDNDQPQIVTLSRLADRLASDEDFLSVSVLYAPRTELTQIVADLITDQHVPFLAALRYRSSGLKKRKDWEHVWDMQRQEDAMPDGHDKNKFRASIPKLLDYTSADFMRHSYWQARGKLDVPKERLISYGSTNVATPDLYGWAGWDHREQAMAIAVHLAEHSLSTEEITPFLAGLLELQPWLDQWHHEEDPDFGISPAAFLSGDRRTMQGEHHLTDDDLRNWRPQPATRGGRRAALRKKKPDTTDAGGDD